ncbi:hypothetical protein B0T26DRAFT_641136 [Lasiosphaeria miniovina]|uniref:RNA polymerase II holoenzyme cyclin-like subunit n=1 Tax=Lasiosphaeria miniovina TaxID=1954250 RepID=A0AA40ATA3_9PEZI|nr:uncharacterized protein B0T26DRAFT_641136 [Lasiosphaeria miniovina]KAK0721620.1 hypothetical protein B0T26DRAFT_641136 [Lasiosphaeria miniovina]
MAPQSGRPPGPANNDQTSDDGTPIGPPSGLSSIPTQYISEQSLRQMLKSIAYDEAREDTYRLKGVQLIDSVRGSLHLPVKTFDTAAVYYHKFRIRFPSSEYNYEDVALASLFVACKVEDTIKKSKEILCAAHNLRQPHDNKTADDKAFESPSRFTVGLERHILETIGFDFRVQYPQKLLIKMVRSMFSPRGNEGTEDGQNFLRVAYDMSIDVYKTFAPIKQSTFTLVLAILELTALFTGKGSEAVNRFKGSQWHSSKASILETMLDLLNLYTQFPRSTKVGARFNLNKLMDVKIDLNKMVSKEGNQRYYPWCDRCAQDALEANPVTPGSATSPATNNSLSGSSTVKRKVTASEGTLRFVFDAELARKERDLIAEYHNNEYEEYEVQVEEPIRETESRHSSRSSHNHSHRNHGSHNSHNDNHGWSPYQRSRHGSHQSDRPKGRKTYAYY